MVHSPLGGQLRTSFRFDQPGHPLHGTPADAVMDRVAHQPTDLEGQRPEVDPLQPGGVVFQHLLEWQLQGAWPVPEYRLVKCLGQRCVDDELRALPALLDGTELALCRVAEPRGPALFFLAPRGFLPQLRARAAQPPRRPAPGPGAWWQRGLLLAGGVATLAGALWLARPASDDPTAHEDEIALEATSGATVTRGTP